MRPESRSRSRPGQRPPGCAGVTGTEVSVHIVVVAVAATGLVADLEAVGQRLEEPHHLVDGANLGAAEDLPGTAEDADRDALVVDIEPDVEHGCLLKSMYLGTAATRLHVTRLTEASFLVSTPRPIDPRSPRSSDTPCLPLH